MEYYSQALDIAKNVGNIYFQHIMHSYLGQACQLTGRLQGAYNNYKLAIENGELIGSNLVEEHYMLSFYGTMVRLVGIFG